MEVEAHSRPLFLDSPLRNWRLQRWFKENEQFGVCDFAVDIKTKTGKTPEGIVSNEVSEIVCKHPSSASSSSTDSNAAQIKPSGNKQEINHSSVNDWQKRWPWMICEPNEKEGKFLLGEIMQAGNFGKYDDRIDRGSKSFMGFKVSDSMSHAIEKTKHNLRLLSHYPEEVLWEPFFRVYHWIWRKLELWRF